MKQVEQENGFQTEIEASEIAEDENLLDGFMEGFTEEKEDEAAAKEEDLVKEEEDGKADDGIWSFKLAITVAVVSLGAAWLGSYLAKP